MMFFHQKTFRSLRQARRDLAINGGWLLHLGDGEYMVTNDPETVLGMRGERFFRYCEESSQWDETRKRFSFNAEDAA